MIVVDDRFSLEKNGFLEIWTWSKVDLDFKNSFQLLDGVKTGILKPATYD